MKKILILLFLCFIKLKAYEYEVYYVDNNNPPLYTAKLQLFVDSNNVLKIYKENKDGNKQYYNFLPYGYTILGHIKKGTPGYISNSVFREYFVKDLKFLNDLLTTGLNGMLNYFYNENTFYQSSYVKYEDYQVLYNLDGLAVECIVNGNWAGLYDGPDKSGYLYNEKGDLEYINGVPVSFFQRINDKLMKRFKINLESIFIKKIFYPLLVLIFVCLILRTVIRMAVKAFLIRFYDNKIRRLEKRRENIENA